MPDIKIDQASLDRIDGLIKVARRNGWNDAINHCRAILPAEYSIKLRGLYDLPDPSSQHAEGVEP